MIKEVSSSELHILKLLIKDFCGWDEEDIEQHIDSVKKYLSGDKDTSFYTTVKVMDVPYEDLPTLINTRLPVIKAYMSWRLMIGK